MRERISTKPSVHAVAIAIERAETGAWLEDFADGTDLRLDWFCLLYNPDGAIAGNGNAYEPELAMAYAWLHVHAPDALIDGEVELGAVPYLVPDGWRFELFPPGTALPASFHQRWS
jgi:hypothetical protein